MGHLVNDACYKRLCGVVIESGVSGMLNKHSTTELYLCSATRLFLGRYNTHLLIPDMEPMIDESTIPLKSSMVNSGFYWSHLEEYAEACLQEQKRMKDSCITKPRGAAHKS